MSNKFHQYTSAQFNEIHALDYAAVELAQLRSDNERLQHAVKCHIDASLKQQEAVEQLHKDLEDAHYHSAQAALKLESQRKQIAELRTVCSQNECGCPLLLAQRKELAAILQQIAAAREALLEYGEHPLRCPASRDAGNDCTCGLSKLMFGNAALSSHNEKEK